MARKILIMVLSSRKGVYGEFMRTQQETWAVDDGDCMTAFYYGVNTTDEIWIEHNEYPFPCSDDYYHMHWKFKLCLDTFLKRNGWDTIFRTNSSAYVNIPNLKKFVEPLPREKLYAGWTLEDTNWDGGGLCVSGAGMFLSRDCAEILARELPEGEACEEDVLIGRLLRPHGIQVIDDRSRVDYPINPQAWRSAYHVRFHSGNRAQDVKDMRAFQSKLL